MRAIIGGMMLALAPAAAEAQSYNAFGGYASNQAGYGRSSSAFGQGFSNRQPAVGTGYGFVYPAYSHRSGYGHRPAREGAVHCQAIGCTTGYKSTYRGYPGYGGAYKGRADRASTSGYSGYSSGQMFREPVDDCRWIGGYGWAC